MKAVVLLTVNHDPGYINRTMSMVRYIEIIQQLQI